MKSKNVVYYTAVYVVVTHTVFFAHLESFPQVNAFSTLLQTSTALVCQGAFWCTQGV